MDSATRPASVVPVGPVVSFVIAVMSVGLTSLVKYWDGDYAGGILTSSSSSSASSFHRSSSSLDMMGGPAQSEKVSVFNMHELDVAQRYAADGVRVALTGDPGTNRTLWQLVSTGQVHGGFERVEPNAWIPSHSHDTEEVLVVLSGSAKLIDELGLPTFLSHGSMVHIKRDCLHAIQNTRTDLPLFLFWMFPVRHGVNKHKFHESYHPHKATSQHQQHHQQQDDTTPSKSTTTSTSTSMSAPFV